FVYAGCYILNTVNIGVVQVFMAGFVYEHSIDIYIIICGSAKDGWDGMIAVLLHDFTLSVCQGDIHFCCMVYDPAGFHKVIIYIISHLYTSLYTEKQVI